MENSEHQLAFIETTEKYDLFFTDKRLVVISKKSHHYMANFVGGAVGGVLFGGVIRDKIIQSQTEYKQQPRPLLENLSINELLEKDQKNYAVPYFELYWMKLNKSRLGNTLTLQSKSKGWKEFKIPTPQTEQLAMLLPTIEALNGKLTK